MDTSMGFTPQSGLLQGTRVGDMDPFVFPYVMKKKGITLTQALEECSRKGGLAGLSGISADMREINAAIAQGNAHARLARDKFIYDIKRYIGEYLVLMEGLDALTFTGGIGQHDAALRREVLSSLGFLGLKIDERGMPHTGRWSPLQIQPSTGWSCRPTKRLLWPARPSGSSAPDRGSVRTASGAAGPHMPPGFAGEWLSARPGFRFPLLNLFIHDLALVEDRLLVNDLEEPQHEFVCQVFLLPLFQTCPHDLIPP